MTEPADARGERLKAQVLDAYRRTTTYHARVQFEFRQKAGRWRNTQSADFDLAFDRVAGRLRVDKPSLFAVVEGGRLRLRAEEIAERYLALAVPAFDYAALGQAVPFLTQPPLPDLALLMAQDPLAVLSNGSATGVRVAEPDPTDPQKRAGLEVLTPLGRIVLRVDPKSSLVTRVSIEANTPNPGGPALAGAAAGGAAGGAGKSGDAVALTYEIEVLAHNEPLDAKLFGFETGTTTAAASFEEWVQGPAGRGGTGAGGESGAAGMDDDARPPTAEGPHR